MTLGELCEEIAQRRWRLTIEPAYFMEPELGTIGVHVMLDPDPENESEPAHSEVVHHANISDAAILAAACRLVASLE